MLLQAPEAELSMAKKVVLRGNGAAAAAETKFTSAGRIPAPERVAGGAAQIRGSISLVIGAANGRWRGLRRRVGRETSGSSSIPHFY